MGRKKRVRFLLILGVSVILFFILLDIFLSKSDISRNEAIRLFKTNVICFKAVDMCICCNSTKLEKCFEDKDRLFNFFSVNCNEVEKLGIKLILD